MGFPGRVPRTASSSVLVLLLAGCGTSNTDHSGPLPNTPTSDDKQPGQAAGHLIKSKDGLSQVRIPSDWEEIDGLNDAAVLQVGKRQQKAYFVVRTFSKRDFPGDDNHHKYAKSWVEKFRESFEDTRLQAGPTELTINGRRALQYEFIGVAPENKARVVLLHTTVGGQAHFHELVAWTNQRRIEESRPVFQAVIASFAETGGKADHK